jgi:hypothetical protein
VGAGHNGVTRSGVRALQRKISTSQVADSLQWFAYALLIVFIAQVLTSLFPLALLQPQWMSRVSAVLRGAATLPLIAMALLMLANMLDGLVLPSSKQFKLMRRICSVVAIGFLLLIPLQSYGAIRSINNQVDESQGQLNKLAAAANKLQKATNEEQLREAIREIPGGEQLANRPLGADVQTVKTGLLARIRPTLKRLENRLAESKSKALQNLILPLIRDGLIAIAYALGFASIGYTKSGSPTLLRRLLKSRSPQLRNSALEVEV